MRAQLLSLPLSRDEWYLALIEEIQWLAKATVVLNGTMCRGHLTMTFQKLAARPATTGLEVQLSSETDSV